MAMERHLLHLLLTRTRTKHPTTTKRVMKKHLPYLKWLLAVCALQLATWNVPAQSKVLINAFNDANEVGVNNGNPWANWFGQAFYQVLWSSSDASNNAASGSMRIEAYYGNSGIGGCCGPQFVVYNQNGGINPPLVGNGGNPASPLATNVEFDIRFDPTSFYVTNTGNWPTIEVGTRGVDFGQHNFGTFTIAATNLGWVHVSMPIAASATWTNIPNIYFKYFSSAYADNAAAFLGMYVDNIVFTTAAVPPAPVTMKIEKAKPGLRMFAGLSQYARGQLVGVDTNQSWVGGTYPVSYSFTLSGYDINPPLNEFHVFWTPMNFVQGGAINQFTDYSTASNNFRLQIVGGAAGTPTVTANLSWKTNAVNANPDHVALTITNNTATGNWNVTFNSATSGTLTAPGAAPAAFSLPADVAATFANPLAFFIGVQPNPTEAIGQHVDLTKVQTVGVAAPGVAINSDFSSPLDTNIWSLAATASAAMLVQVTNSTSWWVASSYPDSGAVLATRPDVAGAVPWKTPNYYTGYSTNGYFQMTMGTNTWTLLPATVLPTVDGSSNGVKAARAFFRTQSPAPAE